ncbi:MAG: transposase, partial [Cyanobacteria bacterium J06648_11]
MSAIRPGYWQYIALGRPTQNALCVAFNRRSRDECLNGYFFYGIGHARHLIANWVHDYNQRRPHLALGYLTPAAYAVALRPQRDDSLELLDGSARHSVANNVHMRKKTTAYF